MTGTGACVSLLTLNLEYLLLLMFVALTGYCKSRVIGAILVLAMGLLRLFGYPVIFLATPIILNELVLAIWLMVKGFNSSAIASESAKADIG